MNPTTRPGAEAQPQEESALPRPQTLPDSSASSGKIWRAGTLTYTTGGLVTLLLWLMWGDFAWSTKERSVSFVVQNLLSKYHVSDFVTSLLLVAIPNLVTIIFGPIISYKSDRHRGRWGRRVPFLAIQAPIAVLAITGLAFSPFMGARFSAFLHSNWLGRDASILIFMGFFWTVFEFASIVCNSLFGAFVNDVAPLAVLGRFYGIFRAISLIAGMMFQYELFGTSDEHYVAIFLGVAVIYLLGFAGMCLKVREGEYPPPDDDPGGSAFSAVAEYFHQCFTKPYYQWVFATIVLPGLAFLPINTFNLYFAQSVKMSTDTFGKLVAFYLFLSLLQTVPVGWLADKFHPLRVAMVCLVLHGAASLWGGLYIHNALTFGVALCATGMLSGTWYTATAALQPALLPKMKFAQYSSALGIVSSLAQMLFGLVLGRALDLSQHQYRYTYLCGFIMDAAGLLATIVVFRMFKQLGGFNSYVAPE